MSNKELSAEQYLDILKTYHDQFCELQRKYREVMLWKAIYDNLPEKTETNDYTRSPLIQASKEACDERLGYWHKMLEETK